MKYTRALLDKDKSVLQTRWLRMVNSREYRSGISYFCRLIKEHQPKFWLLDAVRLSSPPLKDQKWAVKKMSSTFDTVSLKKIAIVLPDDLFLEVVIEKMRENFLQKNRNGIVVKNFRDHTQAEDWLQSSLEQEGLFRVDVIQNEYTHPAR